MIDIIYNHPFYLVGILTTIAMFFVSRELYRDTKHQHLHDHHSEEHKH